MGEGVVRSLESWPYRQSGTGTLSLCWYLETSPHICEMDRINAMKILIFRLQREHGPKEEEIQEEQH